MAGAGRPVTGRPRRGRSRPPHPLRPPLAGAGAVAVLGDGHPAGPARVRLAGHGGRPRSLRRALLQGLQARSRRGGLAAQQLRLGRRGGRLRRPLDRHRRRPGPVAEGHGPRRAAGEAGRRLDPDAAVRGEGAGPLDRHPRRGPHPAGRRERRAHALRPRPLPGLEPRRRPDLRPVPRRQGPPVGGHRRRPRPLGRRRVRALPGRSRGPVEPERRPGARPPGGRRGRALGGHLGRRA